jgi:flavin-dependent dehydrogenase
MIVIADGASGSIEFKRRSRWKPHQVSYAIESEVPVDQETKQSFLEDAGYLDLYFGVSPAGYGWIFPKDDHLTVGVGCRLSDLRDGPELFEHFMKQIPELAKTEIPKPQAHLVPLGGAGRIPTVSDRVLLAGDAGGFVEPLLGEGIYFAILSGQIAGATAVKACGKGRFDANYLRTYEKQCHAVFGIDLDVAYRVARFCYLDNYDMERATKFFFAEKKVRQCMVGLIDGSIRYRDAQTKLLWPYLKFSLMKLGLPIYN